MHPCIIEAATEVPFGTITEEHVADLVERRSVKVSACHASRRRLGAACLVSVAQRGSVLPAQGATLQAVLVCRNSWLMVTDSSRSTTAFCRQAQQPAV